MQAADPQTVERVRLSLNSAWHISRHFVGVAIAVIHHAYQLFTQLNILLIIYSNESVGYCNWQLTCTVP